MTDQNATHAGELPELPEGSNGGLDLSLFWADDESVRAPIAPVGHAWGMASVPERLGKEPSESGRASAADAALSMDALALPDDLWLLDDPPALVEPLASRVASDGVASDPPYAPIEEPADLFDPSSVLQPGPLVAGTAGWRSGQRLAKFRFHMGSRPRARLALLGLVAVVALVLTGAVFRPAPDRSGQAVAAGTIPSTTTATSADLLPAAPSATTPATVSAVPAAPAPTAAPGDGAQAVPGSSPNAFGAPAAVGRTVQVASPAPPVALSVPPPAPAAATAPVVPAPVFHEPVPVTDPPVTDPPVTDPPVTDPPVTDSPVTEPPTSRPRGTTVPPNTTVPTTSTTIPPTNTSPSTTTNRCSEFVKHGPLACSPAGAGR